MRGAPARVVLAGVVVALAAVGVASWLGLRTTWSGSVAPGLYWALVRQRPQTGELVVVCPPQGHWLAQRGYLGRGACPGGIEPIGKPVVAVAGDVVEIGERFVSVNGRRLEGEVARLDSRGRRMVRWKPGRYELGAGQLWLHSSYHPRSLDSRVYGPVEQSAVQEVLVPVATLGDGSVAWAGE